MDTCYSDVEVHKYEYKWMIKKFSIHLKSAELDENEMNLVSSSFSVGTDNKTQWHLKMCFYSNSNINKDYIGLYIVSENSLNGNSKIIAWQEYFFVNALDEKVPWYITEVRKFQPQSCNWGYPKFYEKKKLLSDQNIHLLNDTVTIICRINVIGDKTTFSTSNNCHHSLKFTDNMNNNHINNLSNDLGRLLNSKEFTDFTFIINEKKIETHKTILIGRSPVFAAMFKHSMKESNDNEVFITDVTPEIFEKMLEYIYTNKISGDINNYSMELLCVADKYGLEELKEMCEESLCNNITINNSSKILILADQHNAKKLAEYVQDFMCTHIADIMETEGYRVIEREHPRLGSMLYRTSVLNRMTQIKCEEKLMVDNKIDEAHSED